MIHNNRKVHTHSVLNSSNLVFSKTGKRSESLQGFLVQRIPHSFLAIPDMNFHKFGSHDILMQNCFRTDYAVELSSMGSEECSQKQSFWPNNNPPSSGTIMEHIGSPASAIFLTELYMGLTQYDRHESTTSNPQMLKMSHDLHMPSHMEQPGSCLYADSPPVQTQPHHLSSSSAFPSDPKSQPLSINQHMASQGSYRNPFSSLSEQEQLLHLKCKLLEEYEELNKRPRLSTREPDHEHGLQVSCHLYNPHFTNPKPVGRPCGSISAISSNSAASASVVISKTRIRWTQELHDRFVECVSCLGGADKATPKAILKLMDWEGLTIFHVKSHLQKYRNAKCPESAEGRPDRRASICSTALIDGSSGMQLKEALELQLDVQKKLHEQLEEQRKLQLSIEEQARQLKVIFDKQQETTRSLLESQNSNNTTSPTPSYLSTALENAELLNSDDHEDTHFSSEIR